MKILCLLILTCTSVFLGAGSVFAELCSEGAKICNNKQLCNYATHSGINGVVWTATPRWVEYVSEAKKRGLTCEVTESTEQTDNATVNVLHEQLAKANADLAIVEQTNANLKADLTSSLLAKNETDTKNRLLLEKQETENVVLVERHDKVLLFLM